MMTLSSAMSSYSSSAWTIAIQEAYSFASEAEQATFKAAAITSLATLGTAGMIATSDTDRYVKQGTVAATLVVPASSGASAFAVAGATLALFAVSF